MIKYIKGLYHYFFAFLSAVGYRYPSQDLVVIGITGTKGKSTVISLLTHIFESLDFKVGAISSVEFKIGEKVRSNNTGNTMPGRWFIQRFLSKAKKVGCGYIFLEVTSQGVEQSRHRFIDFSGAGLTCLHPEHIESHGSFEEYRGAKVKFFKDVAEKSKKKRKLFFINSGSSEGRHFEEVVAGYGRTIFYDKETFVRNELKGDNNGLGDWFKVDFNMENAALAFEIAKSQDLSREDIIKALRTFHGFGGRMEVIKSKKGFEVLIDYAHTPTSLEAVYQYVREKKNPKKVIGVFGSAGGGRDKWKRPEFGKISAKYCDQVILTSEDPYKEDPRKIAEEILVGIDREPGFFEIILDRAEAIKKAVTSADEGDIVVITGIGGQDYMHVFSGKINWDERAVVLDALDE